MLLLGVAYLWKIVIQSGQFYLSKQGTYFLLVRPGPAYLGKLGPGGGAKWACYTVLNKGRRQKYLKFDSIENPYLSTMGPIVVSNSMNKRYRFLVIKPSALLQEAVFFNFEYLFATLKGSSAATVLDEFEIFMKADKQLRRDPSMRVLFANLAMVSDFLL